MRNSVELKPQHTKIYLQGIGEKTDFTETFAEELAEARGELVFNREQAKSIIQFSKFEEGRRVIAYTSERQAREYLLYLKVEYSINQQSDKNIAPPNGE